MTKHNGIGEKKSEGPQKEGHVDTLRYDQRKTSGLEKEIVSVPFPFEAVLILLEEGNEKVGKPRNPVLKFSVLQRG